MKPATTGKVGKRGHPATQFKPGQSGNPKGRPVGSRQRLGEKFINDLAADYDVHGAAAIVTLRTEQPAAYIKIVADLMPKDLNLNVDASQAFVEMLKMVSGE